MKKKKIAVLVGSLRKESYNLKMAKAVISIGSKSLDFDIVPIGDLPLYNEDLDEKPPKAWTDFRKTVKTFDGVLFFTPEYNRSIPAVLKNALDVGSRPEGENIWDKMPGAVISVTPYSLGAFGANHHLRQAMVFLNVPMMQQPEAYIGKAKDMFDQKGVLKAASTKKLLQKFIAAFDDWTTANSK